MWVDAHDRIIRVGPAWDAFALDNDGGDAVSGNLLGRPLMHFLTGDAVRYLYRSLFVRVRRTGCTISLPFRCDSPVLRRYMTMHLVPCRRDGIELRSQVLGVEPRDEVRFLDRHQPRSEEYLQVCSWCRKVRLDKGWVEVEEAIAALHLFEAPELPNVSHGVCPNCFDVVHRQLQNGEQPDRSLS